MYEKLVALKDWCENADQLVFWFGFFVAAVLILATQAVLPLADESHLPDGMALNQSGPAPPVTFDDVRPEHWAYEEIELIFSHGITVGCSYDPPLYCPDRPATRAEMAVFAARILEIIEAD